MLSRSMILFPTDTNAHLFKYDSNYGIFNGDVDVADGNLVVNGDTIKVFSEQQSGESTRGEIWVLIS